MAAASAKLSDDALQTVLEADVSTGTRVRALRTLGEVDSARADRVLSSIDSLGDQGQRNALEYLAGTDSEGVELVAEFDDQTTARFFEIDCGGTVGGSAGLLVAPTRTPSGVAFPPDGCDRDVFRRALKQSASDNGNVDAVDAAAVVDEVFSLDGTEQQRAAVLVRQADGEGGAEFLADADGSTIEDVFSFEEDTGRTVFLFSPNSDRRTTPPRQWRLSRIGTVGVSGRSGNTFWNRLRYSSQQKFPRTTSVSRPVYGTKRFV